MAAMQINFDSKLTEAVTTMAAIYEQDPGDLIREGVVIHLAKMRASTEFNKRFDSYLSKLTEKEGSTSNAPTPNNPRGPRENPSDGGSGDGKDDVLVEHS
jgi:hypothetical protein